MLHGSPILARKPEAMARQNHSLAVDKAFPAETAKGVFESPKQLCSPGIDTRAMLQGRMTALQPNTYIEKGYKVHVLQSGQPRWPEAISNGKITTVRPS